MNYNLKKKTKSLKSEQGRSGYANFAASEEMLRSPHLHLSPPHKTQFKHQNLLVKFISKAPFQFHHSLPSPFVHQNSTPKLSGSCRILSGPSGLISPSSQPVDDDFDVELGRLLALLPEEMRRRVNEHPELHQMIEVVMDLGRKPLARFPTGDFVLSEHPITMDDIQHATSLVSLILAHHMFDKLPACNLDF